MEESIKDTLQASILWKIRDGFNCKKTDIRTYSPLTLAYIGDAVYDLIIRSIVVERANRPPDKLHKTVIRYVNAKTQARMAEALETELNAEEASVFRRGRNARPHTTAKNASTADYHKATGLEALFGYLYLSDDMDRLTDLIKIAFGKLGLEI